LSEIEEQLAYSYPVAVGSVGSLTADVVAKRPRRWLWSEFRRRMVRGGCSQSADYRGRHDRPQQAVLQEPRWAGRAAL